MQPSNLSLDPAANLWGNNSPSSNLFAQPSSTGTESSYSTGLPNFYGYGASMGGPVDMSKMESQQPMPTLSANSTSASNDGGAGEVFMGVQTPQPGGIPSWKWTVMSDQPK